MQKFQFARNSFQLIARGIAAIEKLADEIERLNDNLEDVDGDDVQDDD
jgi:chaperonin cofactor prefoldin